MENPTPVVASRKFAAPLLIARAAFILASFLLGEALTSNATSIVILRSPHGTKIVVAADSEFSVAAAAPINSCKILQVEKRYWTTISGLAFEPQTKFDPYEIAAAASSHHPDSLDDIASEVRKRIAATLPSALKHKRKTIGNKAFWQEYKDGFDAQEEAFLGVEQGTLRLVYIQFVLHRGIFGHLRLSSTIQKCPGDACPNPASGFATFLGHHKVIDKFVVDNPDWPRKGNLETQAQRFVQMEIDSEPDCHCSPPISILRMDGSGNTNWVGELGPSCRLPQ